MRELAADLFFDGLFRDLGRTGVLGLHRLRALDEIRDLLSTLATDPLEMTGTVLRGHGLPALLADAAEELGSVFRRGARAALLPDPLVELRTVLLTHKATTHAARLGHRHATTGSPRHGPLLSVAGKVTGRMDAARLSARRTTG